MAEKIVSPGVFTKENDLSFLQQGVAEIGAAFIGPFKEGPLTPTIVNSQAEFETLFGVVDDTYYTPLAVQSYLREAGSATICRVAGIDGYTETAPLLLTATSGSVSASLGILFNTAVGANGGFAGETLTDLDGGGDFNLSTLGSASLDVTDINDIEAVFGTSPFGTKEAYSYGFFKNTSMNFTSATSASVTVLGNQLFTFDAQEALTPTIKSQTISGQRYDLFQFETLGAGNSANTKVKIGITNIKAAGSVNGTDYGTFTVVVRDFADTNKKKNVLETYSNVNLDPNSPNYISRVIGDRKLSINSEGKISESGDWVNNSKYIRIQYLNTSAPVQAVPFGHAKYSLPVSASAAIGALIPSVTFVTASATQYGGIDLDNNTDNAIYLKPIPTGAGVGSNSVFGLDASNGGTLSVGDTTAQFVVAFQEGFDGMSPATPIYTGANIIAGNSQGFDLTTSLTSGSVAYGKHIAALSNADEFDINMMVLPGVIHGTHTNVTNHAIDKSEERADTFLILDAALYSDSVDTVRDNVKSLDSNYTATYYPWVLTRDTVNNTQIYIPATAEVTRNLALTDNIAFPWFAVAGYTRGIVNSIKARKKLTQEDRDTLYQGRINPIATFSDVGTVIWGNKTLQVRESALDRINVRRLLLQARKLISAVSVRLLFDQNDEQVRQDFLNSVNPILDAIRRDRGLYDFRVTVSSDAADLDRNQMTGKIYIKPTKSLEFIDITFYITPTGASFENI